MLCCPLSYVLLHHAMASASGSWGLPKGGMGAVSAAMAAAAREAGAELYTSVVSEMILGKLS